LFESNLKSVDESGDESGLRGSEFHSFTVLVAVLVNRSLIPSKKAEHRSEAKLV